MPRSDGLVRTTVSGQIAARIRLEVQEGELRPGTRLRQNEIAKRFGVSTTPVREAFQILQAQGWLRIDPHRGAIVFRPTVEEMRETFEIRVALEQLALPKAIANIDEEGLEELEGLISEMRGTNDPARWRELNTHFHQRIYEFSNSPHMLGLIQNLRGATIGYSQMATLNAPRSWWADSQHEELLEAIRERDASRAQELIEAHLNLTVSFIMRLLEDEDDEEASASPGVDRAH